MLAAPLNAAAQGLLGERHVGLAFDMYWIGSDRQEQGAGAGVNWPLGSRFDVSAGYTRVGFEGSSSDASVVGLGLCLHGDTENSMVPYVEASGGAAFARYDEAYSAALDVGAQFALSSRVALTPELGCGISWAEDADTVVILSFGLLADVYVTKWFVLLAGGGLDYGPDLFGDKASTAASVGFAFVL
jgi:hypothetical protein